MPGDDIFGVRRGLCVRAALVTLNRSSRAKAARTHRPRRTPKTASLDGFRRPTQLWTLPNFEARTLPQIAVNVEDLARI